DIKVKREMKGVKVPSGEKFLFHEFNKTVEKPTGNFIISEKDFLKLNNAIKNAKKKEKKLNDILETDIYKENIQLKKELKEEKEHKSKIIKEAYSVSYDYEDKIKALKEENTILKATVSDLREELELIYYVSEKMNLKNKNSQFKRKFEKEFIDKPKITLKELKQIAEMKKENEGMNERENNLNKKRSGRSR